MVDTINRFRNGLLDIQEASFSGFRPLSKESLYELGDSLSAKEMAAWMGSRALIAG